MSYLGVEDCKRYLGIPRIDVSRDEWVGSLIAVAEATVSQICRRDFRSPCQYLEYYSGSGTNRLVLRQSPVYSVLGVWSDDDAQGGQAPTPFTDDKLLTPGVDYLIDHGDDSAVMNPPLTTTVGAPNTQPAMFSSGILVRLRTIWPSVIRNASVGWLSGTDRPSTDNIKVVYTASSVPVDVKFATAELIAKLMRVAPLGGDAITHERIKDYEYRIGGKAKQVASEGSIAGILATHTSVANCIV